MATDYNFTSAFPPGHLVADYVAYASSLCDAAHDYHEAGALVALATLSPDVRVRLKQFMHGLRTNIYTAFIGATSTSRKSTAASIATELITRATGLTLLSDKATPEAFAEELSKRHCQFSLWVPDEYAVMLKQIHRREFMTGLSSLLLELYQRDSYTYKRMKGDIIVKDSHLSILGCAADTIFDALHTDDVESGLLPRHAIIYPSTKPATMPFSESSTTDDQTLNELVQRLKAIGPLQLDPDGRYTGGLRHMKLTTQAFEIVDAFQTENEKKYSGEMQARVIPMLIKIGMLASLGDARNRLRQDLTVTSEDMERAAVVVRRWSGMADAFQTRIGESAQGKLVRRALAFLTRQPADVLPVRSVFRHLHTTAAEFRGVQEAMEIAGYIELLHDNPNARTTDKPNVWRFKRTRVEVA